MPVNGSTLIPWIVDVAGADTNGGTSTAVLASAADGATAAGTSTLTSASAAFTSALIGHGIQIGANWRLVTAVADATHLTYSGASLGTLSAQTYTIGGSLRTLNKVANLAGAPLAAGDVIALAPSFLQYREAVTLGQSGAAVGGAITNVSAAAPAVVTTTSAHGLVVGQWVYITGVLGASEINGLHLVTAVGSTTTYTIDNAAAPSAYTSGGATEQLIAIVGDVDGQYTGKVGDVVLTGWTLGDMVVPGVASTVVVNGKSGWAVIDVEIISGSSRCVIAAAGSQWLAFRGCTFVGDSASTSNCFDYTSTADTAAHLWIEQCLFFAVHQNNVLLLTSPTTATAADYTLDVVITNCVFEATQPGSSIVVSFASTGANAHKAGGALVRNCTVIGDTVLVSADTNTSVTIPVVVQNCALFGGSSGAVRATTAGNLVEDYNGIRAPNPRSNTGPTLAGSATFTNIPPAVEVGQSVFFGRTSRAHFAPAIGSELLGAGNTEIAVSGPAGTIADDATVGTITWSNPGNAGYPDASNATAVLTLAADSHYLKFTNFGFHLPGNAVIDGIRVELLCSAANAGALAFSGGSAGLKLVKGGVIAGNNHTNTVTISTLSGFRLFGGHCDLWGNSWTASDINASTFGFVVAIHASAASTASIDYGRVIVYYHLPTPAVAVDLLSRPRPAGGVWRLATGTATAGGATTLTDSGAAFGVNEFAFCVLAITGGTGAGQRKVIASNTATVITVDSTWQTNPDNTSTYTIYLAGGGICETGKASAGAGASLTGTGAAWQANQWTGATLEITSGTGAGQIVPVLTNTATVLTIGPESGSQWATTPDSTSIFALYRGIGGVSAVQAAVGAYERHDTGERVTTPLDTGATYALALTVPADQDRPLNAASGARTYTVRYRSEAGVVPTVTVKANRQVGLLADVVATGSAGQSSYTTLTCNFTTTAPGRVIVRLGATGTLGNRAFFDSETLA